MTPERWQQIKELVNSALEQKDENRATVLHQSCADDPAMIRGVEALLSFHEQATHNLSPASALLNEHHEFSPERWELIDRIFNSAMGRDPEDQGEYLVEVCGTDEALRREVEALLVFQTGVSGVIHEAIQDAAGSIVGDKAPQSHFAPGMILNKRYRIVGLLGRGGMGEVYRADDLKLGHPVALKFITGTLTDKTALARFHKEVSLAHRVTHPNVCRVHDIGEVTTSWGGTLHFLTMEYVDGEDLSSLLRRIGRLPEDKAVEIATQLCAGLAAAHEAGVLHRDLKPANVMLDGKGRVRITDFGLAGFAEQIGGGDAFAGTPAYMSPEQFAGKEVTVRSDIYALGLVLYEIFTGKHVFEAETLAELRRLHESSSPSDPSNWVKDIDPLVERVILRCLEKDPAKRLASAKQVADALPGGDPLVAALAMGDTPSPEMVAASGEKTGLRPWVAVACLIAIIAGLIAYAWLNRKTSLLEMVPFDNSPEVLARKGREMIAQLGYPERPFDAAFGLHVHPEYLYYLNAKKVPTPERLRRLETGRGGIFHHWYRESPVTLIPESRWSWQVGEADPPRGRPRMAGIELDTLGRLLRFSAIPPEFEPTKLDPSQITQSAPDWKVLFDLAGLDQSRFTPAESQWNPDGSYDVRTAWTGTSEDMPDVALRIEAASYRGKFVPLN